MMRTLPIFSGKLSLKWCCRTHPNSGTATVCTDERVKIAAAALRRFYVFYHHLKEQLHQNKADPDVIPAIQHNPNTIQLRFRLCWRLICVLS
jgi:hypothetical protein